MLLIFDSLPLAVDDLLQALKHEPNFYFQDPFLIQSVHVVAHTSQHYYGQWRGMLCDISIDLPYKPMEKDR